MFNRRGQLLLEEEESQKLCRLGKQTAKRIIALPSNRYKFEKPWGREDVVQRVYIPHRALGRSTMSVSR